ncbi:Hypothetical predicted protein [Podarcis lilfordi]|uniref:Uncharacterized protein n=1 Tax=Podarcis lilfordi TaxID=74358 RepID=A0AA35L3T9_9SAUR|nr:Hypothetical predicted protein [Podarcis lilfordi]
MEALLTTSFPKAPGEEQIRGDQRKSRQTQAREPLGGKIHPFSTFLGGEGRRATWTRAMDRSDDTVEIPALGRPFQLGMLYDCRKDALIPDTRQQARTYPSTRTSIRSNQGTGYWQRLTRRYPYNLPGKDLTRSFSQPPPPSK